MSQKVLYLIIGLLTGLLIMEWVVSPAESQTTTVRAQEFRLVDANGQTSARLYNDAKGPILQLARSGGPVVRISTSSDGYASISVEDRSGHWTFISSALLAFLWVKKGSFPSEKRG